MAGPQAAPTDGDGRADQAATPLPLAVAAAGLASAVRVGPEAARGAPPQVAQWDAIRSHYPAEADWHRHQHAAMTGPITIYRRCTPGRQA